MLKICFIGLGSIGTRHLKNIRKILDLRKQAYVIDVLRSSNTPLPTDIDAYIKGVYCDIEQLPSGYDIIFITNPTSLHYETLLSAMHKAKHFFIEKPIFEDMNYDLTPFKQISGICYVACPMRYTLTMMKLKQIITSERIFSVDAKCSSYLPDWRPQTDYRMTYSAKKALGGGVDIDLIHEWDYIVDLFGFPMTVKCMKGRFSDLEIDSNDVALYIAEYDDKLVEVHLDYFGRVPQRKIELYTANDVIAADLIAGTISYLKSGKVIRMHDERDGYQTRELESFLDMTVGRTQNTNNIRQAMKTLEVALTE